MSAAPRVGRLDAGEPLTITIGLAPRDLGALRTAAADVADPASPSYRRYVTAEGFAARFGATAADYDAVTAWATSHKLAVKTHASRLVLEASGSAADIEAALDIELVYATRADGSRFRMPSREPSIDSHVAIVHIGNLDDFTPPRHAAGGSGIGGARTGTDFRHAYAPCTTAMGAGQTIGIFMMDGFLQSDVDAYIAATGLPHGPAVQVVPAGTATDIQVEGSLDVQMALSMAPAAQIVAFTGSTNQILANMAANPHIKQFSSSWFTRLDDTSEVLLAQLALQGQSFFQASGDDGAVPDGYFHDSYDFRLQPSVTIVGGTALSMNGSGASYGTETTWPGSSGGKVGFVGLDSSGYSLPIPAYQQGLANSANGASSSRRNFPDVSAEASAVSIVFNGSPLTVGGTSAATPLWAGFMALVNERAAAQNVPSVGSPNPALYSLARSAYSTSFHDITTGAAPSDKPENGGLTYSAVPGYDLATGLGSPQCALIDALVDATKVTWSFVPGCARSIGAGGSGGPWITGCTPWTAGSPDNAIAQYDGGSWSSVAGGAVKAAVSQEGVPWVINTAGTAFKRTGSGWQVVNAGLCFTEIAVGTQDDAYAIGCDAWTNGSPDKKIYHREGAGWTQLQGGAVRIAASPLGTAWAINTAGTLFRLLPGGSWTVMMPGTCFRAIDVNGNDDTAIALGCAPWQAGSPDLALYAMKGGVWRPLPGGAVRVALTNDNVPWAVNSAGNVFMGSAL